MKNKYGWLAFLSLLSLVVCKKQVGAAPVSTFSDSSIAVKVTKTVLLKTNLKLGVTYSQNFLNASGDTAAINRARNLMKGLVIYHNQHIHGFGVNNIQPKPGIYDWGTLDKRILKIKELNAVPVITLATAPTWMVDSTWVAGKYPNETDWSMVEKPPLLQHVQDFADLCAKVAQRYPDVKYFQVWNELKGMWNPALNRWDYERYTTLYNAVYTAVKAVRPDALIGGPYAVLTTYMNPKLFAKSSISSPAYGTIDKRDLEMISYWLSHKAGADFICVDGKTKTKDGVLVDIIEATRKFFDLSRWIKSQTNLPVWWSEDYINQSNPADSLKQPAAMASMLAYHALAGDAVSLRWGPELQSSSDDKLTSLFSSTQNRGGGQPLPNYYVYRDFNKFFPAGTTLFQTEVSSERIMALASDRHLLLINRTGQPQKVKVNQAAEQTLLPFQALFTTL
ncbi:MAG: hypothetical protein JWR72_2698 [Flavisolibacter sp.]|jgi:hypothetical protein|nr:hypothetical protein [Flavisolibacter sp.]